MGSYRFLAPVMLPNAGRGGSSGGRRGDALNHKTITIGNAIMTVNRLTILCGAVAALIGATASAVDVTIGDTLTPSNNFGAPHGPVGEWREVETGAASGTQWDLRGFDMVEVTKGVQYTLTAFGGY